MAYIAIALTGEHPVSLATGINLEWKDGSSGSSGSPWGIYFLVLKRWSMSLEMLGCSCHHERRICLRMRPDQRRAEAGSGAHQVSLENLVLWA